MFTRSVAFDPLFMMHHANVDRILSLWQVIHPDVWVCRGSAREGTFAIGQDQLVDGDTRKLQLVHCSQDCSLN